MHVFYDLETTGLDTKHQILTACFIVTDNNFEISSVQNFRVALNPLEIPTENAIAVNAVDITQHMLHHKNRFDDLVTEEEFAKKVNALLSKHLKAGNALIGYNSNKFDIKHLRKTLIKWGYNPYYNYNKFLMVDLYNHIKFLKLSKPKEFIGIPNLKLGSVFKQLVKKDPRYLHEAESDVQHCIDLAKFLVQTYDWHIVEENAKVNNLFSLGLCPGDVVMIANPYTETVQFDKCIVHDVTQTYVLLEKTNVEENENKFSNVHKTDFRIGKKISEGEIDNPMTVEKYFNSFEGEKGVESFVYHLNFKDFQILENVREQKDFAIGSSKTHLGEMINSQILTRSRPVRHTSEGLEVDTLEDEEKEYICYYFSKYGVGDDDVFDAHVPQNEDKVQLLKEYKAAYKELLETLK